MANTQQLKTQIEPFVREWLSAQFHQAFTKEFLQLAGCVGSHEFDAVSTDRRIVCGIKSSSGPTSGGKNPSGKISGAYEELYFLASVEADQRFLVVTDPDFYGILSKRIERKLTRGIKLLYCPLSAELSQLVRKVQSEANREIDRGKHASLGDADY